MRADQYESYDTWLALGHWGAVVPFDLKMKVLLHKSCPHISTFFNKWCSASLKFSTSFNHIWNSCVQNLWQKIPKMSPVQLFCKPAWSSDKDCSKIENSTHQVPERLKVQVCAIWCVLCTTVKTRKYMHPGRHSCNVAVPAIRWHCWMSCD